MASRMGFCVLIFLLYLAPAHSTNYYVAQSGSNANNGLSLANALATIQYAVDNLLSAGDTLFVADGSYAGFDNRSASGTESDPVVFKALGSNCNITSSGPIRDDGINIEGVDYNIVDGFISNNMTGGGNGIRVVLADHCIVRNCTTQNNAERGIFTGFTDDIIIENNVCSGSVDEHGIYVSNSSDRAIIRYNTCYGNNATGIHCNADASAGGDGISDDFEIYGNIIYDNNQAAGINMDGIRNARVYNNVIFNNHHAQGIALFQIDGALPSTGASIFNNTIIVPSDGRWGILFINGSHQGARVYNNIILTQHASRGCISTTSLTNFNSDYNLLDNVMNYIDDNPGNAVSLATWQSVSGLDQHSLLAGNYDLIFEDFDNDDFHLTNGSAAINAGTDLVSEWVLLDHDNRLRPAGGLFDMGAYERNGVLLDCNDGMTTVSNPLSSNYIGVTTSIVSDAVLDQDMHFIASDKVELQPSFEVPIPYTLVIGISSCKK